MVTNGYVKLSCQLEEGSTATDYVAHQEQTYTIPIQAPFRSIGTTRDDFVKQDGVWYERHKIREYDLGNCTWQPVNNDSSSRTQGLFGSWSLQNIKNYGQSQVTIPNLLSNKYIIKPNYNFLAPGRNPQNYTMSTYNGRNIYIQNSDFSEYTNEQVKTALSGTILNYELATPTLTACTSEQTAILESLPRTYKNITHIYSEDEVQAVVDVTYYKDLETVINNLDARLTLVEE